MARDSTTNKKLDDSDAGDLIGSHLLHLINNESTSPIDSNNGSSRILGIPPLRQTQLNSLQNNAALSPKFKREINFLKAIDSKSDFDHFEKNKHNLMNLTQFSTNLSNLTHFSSNLSNFSSNLANLPNFQPINYQKNNEFLNFKNNENCKLDNFEKFNQFQSKNDYYLLNNSTKYLKNNDKISFKNDQNSFKNLIKNDQNGRNLIKNDRNFENCAQNGQNFNQNNEKLRFDKFSLDSEYEKMVSELKNTTACNTNLKHSNYAPILKTPLKTENKNFFKLNQKTPQKTLQKNDLNIFPKTDQKNQNFSKNFSKIGDFDKNFSKIDQNSNFERKFELNLERKGDSFFDYLQGKNTVRRENYQKLANFENSASNFENLAKNQALNEMGPLFKSDNNPFSNKPPFQIPSHTPTQQINSAPSNYNTINTPLKTFSQTPKPLATAQKCQTIEKQQNQSKTLKNSQKLVKNAQKTPNSTKIDKIENIPKAAKNVSKTLKNIPKAAKNGKSTKPIKTQKTKTPKLTKMQSQLENENFSNFVPNQQITSKKGQNGLKTSKISKNSLIKNTKNLEKLKENTQQNFKNEFSNLVIESEDDSYEEELKKQQKLQKQPSRLKLPKTKISIQNSKSSKLTQNSSKTSKSTQNTSKIEVKQNKKKSTKNDQNLQKTSKNDNFIKNPKNDQNLPKFAKKDEKSTNFSPKQAKMDSLLKKMEEITNQKQANLSLWKFDESTEKENIKKFWESLSGERRRQLVDISKNMIVTVLATHFKISCVCGKCHKRERYVFIKLSQLYDRFYYDLIKKSNENTENENLGVICLKDKDLSLRVKISSNQIDEAYFEASSKCFASKFNHFLCNRELEKAKRIKEKLIQTREDLSEDEEEFSESDVSNLPSQNSQNSSISSNSQNSQNSKSEMTEKNAPFENNSTFEKNAPFEGITYSFAQEIADSDGLEKLQNDLLNKFKIDSVHSENSDFDKIEDKNCVILQNRKIFDKNDQNLNKNDQNLNKNDQNREIFEQLYFENSEEIREENCPNCNIFDQIDQNNYQNDDQNDDQNDKNRKNNGQNNNQNNGRKNDDKINFENKIDQKNDTNNNFNQNGQNNDKVEQNNDEIGQNFSEILTKAKFQESSEILKLAKIGQDNEKTEEKSETGKAKLHVNSYEAAKIAIMCILRKYSDMKNTDFDLISSRIDYLMHYLKDGFNMQKKVKAKQDEAQRRMEEKHSMQIQAQNKTLLSKVNSQETSPSHAHFLHLNLRQKQLEEQQQQLRSHYNEQKSLQRKIYEEMLKIFETKIFRPPLNCVNAEAKLKIIKNFKKFSSIDENFYDSMTSMGYSRLLEACMRPKNEGDEEKNEKNMKNLRDLANLAIEEVFDGDIEDIEFDFNTYSECCKMFQCFAIRLFHQRVLKAYLEMVSERKQMALLEEEEQEKILNEIRRHKKKERRRRKRAKKKLKKKE